MRAPAAVLFDLWGTLVPGIQASVRDGVSRQMATDLGVDTEAFAAAYRDSYRERFLGLTGDLDETVKLLAGRCGGSPAAAAVQRAASRRLELTTSLLASDARTLAVLDALHARRFLLGLVSDSSVETPLLWAASPLAQYMDAVAFSCELGVRKPDPRLFLQVLEALGCGAADCVYVGDGGGRELTAAAALGMLPIRLRAPGSAPTDRYDDDAGFAGAEVAALGDLLELPWAATSERAP